MECEILLTYFNIIEVPAPPGIFSWEGVAAMAAITTPISFVPPPRSRGGSSSLVGIELNIRKNLAHPPTSSLVVRSGDKNMTLDLHVK